MSLASFQVAISSLETITKYANYDFRCHLVSCGIVTSYCVWRHNVIGDVKTLDTNLYHYDFKTI